DHRLPSQGVHLFWWTPHASEHSKAKGAGKFALTLQFFVKPSELELERPYIERNIALTRQAYNLDQIAAKPFAAEQKLSFKTLDANKACRWRSPAADLLDLDPSLLGGPQAAEIVALCPNG
ncbi:UPF0182 family protein, partial [Bradyrhizobium sp. 162]|uniref:UPF0182 family protein n=1 Tax=Bradyrhizobium sp. 162 TaxID=2782635 RepID=UPI001FFA2050